jgi:hypothetical protein
MCGAIPPPPHLYNLMAWFFIVQRVNFYYVYVFELRIQFDFTAAI